MKKVKKFGRGGDILTGLGAGLAAYGAYKHFFGKDDQGKDTNTGLEKGIETGKKKNLSILDEVAREDARKNEDKKAENKTDSGRNSSRSPVEEHGYITKRDEFSDATPVPKNDKKPKKADKKDDNKKGGSNNTTTTTTNNASSFTGMAGTDTGGSKKLSTDSTQNKESEHQKFLRTRAGLSGKGIPTPGNRKKTEATLEPSARTKNVIKAVQGTLDNAFKSTVRSDKDKMAEGAREVERRRQAEKKKRADEAYMRELERGKAIKKGGMVKKYASGGSVKTAKPTMRSASSRADGIAIRGKTRA